MTPQGMSGAKILASLDEAVHDQRQRTAAAVGQANEQTEAEQMPWTYRVMRHHKAAGEDEEDWLAIHEVYTLDSGVSWTEKPITVEGATKEELRASLQRMLACLDRPVLDESGAEIR